jgi:pectin methylesterase-like acyl-CoA thioesterase
MGRRSTVSAAAAYDCGDERNRLILAVVVAAINLVALTAAAPSAFAASICVGPSPGCFSTLQAAIAAAHDGDTIHVAAGTFAGGVTITKSVRLVGAGAGSTVIRGGDSVLTIGAFGAASEPTVSIDGVSISS